jgi:L-phenylalanine/L-methionine N-acetyltransferase
MERPAIAIRSRELSDGDALAAMALQRSVMYHTLQMPYQSPEVWRKRASDTSPSLHSLVAEIDGMVVGEITLQLASAHRKRHSAEIGMMVHEGYRGRGVGRTLMEAILDLADNWLNLRRIELHVYVDNEAAIYLYERFGFVKEGTLRDLAFRDGEYVDAYAMSRIRQRPGES